MVSGPSKSSRGAVGGHQAMRTSGGPREAPRGAEVARAGCSLRARKRRACPPPLPTHPLFFCS